MCPSDHGADLIQFSVLPQRYGSSIHGTNLIPLSVLPQRYGPSIHGIGPDMIPSALLRLKHPVTNY